MKYNVRQFVSYAGNRAWLAQSLCQGLREFAEVVTGLIPVHP